MKRGIWLSFDLGLRGDYEGMFTFLDSREAQECGDSMAYLKFEFDQDLLAELADQLKQAVHLDQRSRVYAIFPDSQGGYKGRFIVGKRKPSPWAGYGAMDVTQEDIGG